MRDAKPHKLIKALKEMGFTENGGSKHLKMVKGDITVMVPTHGTIKRETVDRIRKHSGVEKALFYRHNFS